jgi:hypothetical protein
MISHGSRAAVDVRLMLHVAYAIRSVFARCMLHAAWSILRCMLHVGSSTSIRLGAHCKARVGWRVAHAARLEAFCAW